MNPSFEVATFAGGCFWCIESAFNSIKGVNSALSGYMGGHTINPTYEDICTGQSGHAEVVQINFNPEEITYRELLEILFSLHDPTQLNRQGNDVGTQYRSAIYYHNQAQKLAAETLINEINASSIWPTPVVTEITAEETFYCAENYHQDYVSNNPQNPYCQMLVLPKLVKFKARFLAKLK